MRRLAGILVLLLLLVGVARTQVLLTTSPVLIGTTTPLVLDVSRYNELNVVLTANTPINFSTPLISDTLAFRLNICESQTGGFTPTFGVVNSAQTIVNRVGNSIQSTAAGYCETQNWTYRSRSSQVILENVSPPTGGSGGGAAGAFLTANNLSECNKQSCRNNLGLGSSATHNLPTTGNLNGFDSADPIKNNNPLPTTNATLNCTATAGGNFPTWDWYSGSLSGNSVTYTLPSAGCVDNSTIGVSVVQDGNHTVQFVSSAPNGIEGSCSPLGLTASNSADYFFKWSATRNSWQEHCGGSVPASATGPATGLINTVVSVTAGQSPVTVASTPTLYQADATNGAINLNLPACTSANVGLTEEVNKTDSTSNAVTFVANGTDTIAGAATLANTSPNGPTTIKCSKTAGRWLQMDYVVPKAGAKLSSVTNSTGNAASTGFINDINAHQSIAAVDAANDGNDIQEIGTDMMNNVHIGGGATKTVILDNSTTVSQGSTSAGAYLDAANANTAYGGAQTETCAQKWHVYTLNADVVINLVCPGGQTANQTLDYYFVQPATGSTFAYTFTAGGGAKLLGDTPIACNVNSCIDQVEVTYVPGALNAYVVHLIQADIGGGATCPAGQTCYYVDPTGGSTSSDTYDGTESTHTTGVTGPWQTVTKANGILSSLAPGDRLLFKTGGTWNQQQLIIGDSASRPTHALAGTSVKPIIISTYGGAGYATFDEQNANPYCVAAINTDNNFPPGNAAHDFTVSNIKCLHAYSQGMTFNGTGLTGITISNNDIEDTGQGGTAVGSDCAITTGACKPITEDPPDWSSGSHVANDATHNGLIMPLTNNASRWWYRETVASCTSGTQPNWAASCPNVGNTCSDNTCSWVQTGVSSVYKNQLQAFNSNTGGFANGIHFLNNIVKWGGGHNLLQVHHDTGTVLVQGNIIGPGGNHGDLDVKSVGNSTNLAQVLNNTVTCGFSLGQCGCQNNGSIGNSICVSAATPAYFTLNEVTGENQNMLYALNVAYDSPIGLQICPNSTGTGCGSSSSCPIAVKYFNNTLYIPKGLGGTVFGSGIYGACTSNTGSAIDLENNILDGGNTNTVDVGTGWASTFNGVTTKEQFNDIGGAQGNTGFTFNGRSTLGVSDLLNSNPLYLNSGGTPPDFTPTCPGAAVCNAAATNILVTGHPNMGAK